MSLQPVNHLLDSSTPVEDVADHCESWSRLGPSYSEDAGRCSYSLCQERETNTAGLRLASHDASSHTWIALYVGGGDLF